MDYRDLKNNMAAHKSIAAGANQSGDGATNGTSVDCQDDSNDPVVQAVVEVGAVTGTPTSFTATFKLQESDDESDWSDCNGADNAVISAASTSGIVRALRSKRYTRVVSTLDFTGGTTPAADIGATILLRKRSVG